MTTQANAGRPAHPAYRKDVDGLRAVAVLAVVGYHAFPGRITGGFVGVDIFFVISGFLISGIILSGLEQGTFTFGGFYARRIKRIFPALVVILLACYALGWFALLGDEYKQLGRHIAAGAGFVSNFVLWKEAGYFDTAAELKPLLHLWSLGVEEQFYIFWPLLLYVGWKARISVLWITLVLLLASFVLNIRGVHGDPVGTFYSFATRIWELLVGSVLAYVSLFRPALLAPFGRRAGAKENALSSQPDRIFAEGSAPADVLCVIGVLLIAAAVLLIDKRYAFPGWWALLPVIGTLLLLAAGPAAWINRRVLSQPMLVWIGLISYPLYLWHWPILAFARIVESSKPAVAIRVAAIGLSFVLAWLTYKVIERPIRFGSRSRVRVMGLCLVMLMIGFVGYNTDRRDGLEFRAAVKGAQANKFVPLYRQRCDALTGSSYEDDWCNAGNAVAEPSMLLIGDSFSNVYVPMLSAAARYADFTFAQYGRGQCPMLVDYGPEYCREITRKVMERASRSPAITTIVLAFDWQAYKNGRDFTWLNYRESPEVFRDSLIKTVDYYEAINKKIVILLSPPTGANPKACIIRPVALTARHGCTLPLNVAREYESDYKALLTRILGAHPDIRTFDPFKYLCDERECRIVDGQHILFIDDTHLSGYGAEFLANAAKEELRSLLETCGENSTDARCRKP